MFCGVSLYDHIDFYIFIYYNNFFHIAICVDFLTEKEIATFLYRGWLDKERHYVAN